MRISWWMFSVALLLMASCSSKDRINVDLAGKSWSIEGRVVAKPGVDVGHRRVELLRMDEIGGVAGGRVFMVIRTNTDGSFYFESPVDGNYTVVVHGDFPCTAHADIGTLVSEAKRVVIRLPSGNCMLSM